MTTITLTATKRLYLLVFLASISCINARAVTKNSTASIPSQQNQPELASNWKEKAANQEEERVGPNAPDLIAAGKGMMKATETKLPSVPNLPDVNVGSDRTKRLLNKVRLDENMFKSKEYQAWAKSVRKRYKAQRPQVDQAKISALTSKYGTENVVRVIFAAKGVQSTKRAAEKLETALLKSWADDQKSLEDVFTLLKLGEKNDDLFQSPELTLWFTYARRVKDEKPYDWLFQRLSTRLNNEELKTALVEKWKQDVQQMMDAFASKETKTFQLKDLYLGPRQFDNEYKWLVQRFSEAGADDRLAHMIVDAKKGDVKVRVFATLLARLQQGEMKSRGTTVDEAFDLLKLSRTKRVFESPVLPTWISFAESLKKEPYKRLFTTLNNWKQNDDYEVALFLAQAEKKGINKSIINKIQEEQRQKWKRDGTSVEEMFRILKLDTGDVKQLERFWSTWVLYVPIQNPAKVELRKQTMLKQMSTTKNEDSFKIISTLDKLLPGDKLVKFFEQAHQIDSMKDFAKMWEKKVLAAYRSELVSS